MMNTKFTYKKQNRTVKMNLRASIMGLRDNKYGKLKI